MVTDKAREIWARLKSLPDWDIGSQRLVSDELVEELVERCRPTEEEFDELMTGALLSARVIYRILIGKYLYRWDRLSND